jgi:hypothetical protein
MEVSGHGAESILRSQQLLSHSRNSQNFIEHENPLPSSQEPTIGFYPESDESNPHPQSYFSEIHFNIFFPSTFA